MAQIGNQPYPFNDKSLTVLVAPNNSNPSQYQYIGEALPGTLPAEAKWRIKLVYDNGANSIEVKWATSTTNFDKVWNDRESYQYI